MALAKKYVESPKQRIRRIRFRPRLRRPQSPLQRRTNPTKQQINHVSGAAVQISLEEMIN